MNKQQIEEIRARCDKATPGPWIYPEPDDANSDDPYCREGYVIGPQAIQGLYETMSYEPPDSRFIAHARQDIPALLDYIEELEAEIATVEKR